MTGGKRKVRDIYFIPSLRTSISDEETLPLVCSGLDQVEAPLVRIMANKCVRADEPQPYCLDGPCVEEGGTERWGEDSKGVNMRVVGLLIPCGGIQWSQLLEHQ